MKVSELMPPLLDYYVGMAENVNPSIIKGRCYSDASEVANGGLGYWEPSKEWTRGGPIIERECISLVCWEKDAWGAYAGRQGAYFDVYPSYDEGSGPTVLIAAMRAYVALKFGEEVPDETPEAS